MKKALILLGSYAATAVILTLGFPGLSLTQVLVIALAVVFVGSLLVGLIIAILFLKGIKEFD
ncbi:MAG: hypothetical protein UX12_C0029G0007 [Candidatus Collierbacteria bacterium GW2011_GWC1_45_47]|uniref:Uncharacterized protein n=3 Tax=Candidatus Collieribacteriota TaxID=1752725 RepID=A0A0G1JPI8_9BACT|nr:MAG: hypothetical protein UW23_C0015G0012 [Candidatus Collierbacteria bacterium GW2011_GWA1_44_12]KKT45882.1 MAG: hypothetical protein UW35_C0028G0011 [Candidatus Collierbacteria bacterium GW2011_GWF2_44_15]KKU08867.1 MAG: hypothetical protein UX12_C0029G0007 [Candidatus Collierbacteria bacterium GW2011_GWC1_45_47]KKU27843.1 MAG: hypothetical protein UX41_C0042G0011 [Candidatus Collierbacteria bacterium GW2011_GWE1_46_18]